MKLALRLKADIFALMDEFRRSRPSEDWSDTAMSMQALNDRNFIMTLRRWDGGPKSPTLERVAKFEDWLRTQIGEARYDVFRSSRAADLQRDIDKGLTAARSRKEKIA